MQGLCSVGHNSIIFCMLCADVGSGVDGLVAQQISGHYVCLHSDIFYKYTSLMEAVDVCVKATFVFSLLYPEAANSARSFVQRSVYGLSSGFDRLSSKVIELLTDTAAQ